MELTPIHARLPALGSLDTPDFGEISNVAPTPDLALRDDSAVYSAGDSFSFDEELPTRLLRGLCFELFTAFHAIYLSLSLGLCHWILFLSIENVLFMK